MSLHGLPVKNGVKMSLPKVATSTVPLLSQMFKVPVEKHGINGHLRQKGKIAELALGYGGSVGVLKDGRSGYGATEEELHPW